MPCLLFSLPLLDKGIPYVYVKGPRSIIDPRAAGVGLKESPPGRGEHYQWVTAQVIAGVGLKESPPGWGEHYQWVTAQVRAGVGLKESPPGRGEHYQ